VAPKELSTMHANAALGQGKDHDRSPVTSEELNDAWFDAAPSSSRRIRSLSSPELSPTSQRAVRQSREAQEIDPVADAWFR
jgi:hypothetical protein